MHTIKYHSSNGLALWQHTYNYAGNFDEGTDCGIDGQGNIYVLGRSIGYNTGNDFITIKYNSTGTIQWQKRFDGPVHGWDYPHSLDVEGSWVCVTGNSEGSGSVDDYLTVMYNTETGDTLWTARYNGLGNWVDEPAEVVISPEGDVYVTGYCSVAGSDNTDIVTMKYNVSGQLQWLHYYNGPMNYADAGTGICLDPFGNIYVCGHCWVSGQWSNYIVIKYSPAGQMEWFRTYDGPAHGMDRAKDVIADSNFVYVTGYSPGEGTGEDYATVKYTSEGDTVWIRRWDGSFHVNDQANAIALDGFGNVCVTGYTREVETNDDYTTIKYAPDGDTIWVQYFNGQWVSSIETAYAIGTDAAGNVLVAGTGTGPTGASDYATVKYMCSLDLNLVPLSYPIQIPAAGGSFFYDIGAENIANTAISFEAWCMATLPNGSLYGPLMGPVSLWLPAGSNLSRTRTQTIPGSAPAGDYVFTALIGDYPDEIWTTSGFPFTKLAGDDEPEMEEWKNYGEEFTTEPIAINASPAKIPGNAAISISPNPFNPTTAASYELRYASHVSLRIYNTAGRLVATLVNGWRGAGPHEVTFDGSGLPSGVYLVRLEAGEASQVQKVVLLK